ncbi:hypothetical protein KPH14_005283 [Odynerus spinipes]|uniref:Non-homologous end-joining factor 1 n=1 Tax=Odynerus spinipes TaxID=1348599 RepID=A0AAD9VJ36_9HYME|nr:hypothetical protein KPH14_005283 [Odynerus spinipes]
MRRWKFMGELKNTAEIGDWSTSAAPSKKDTSKKYPRRTFKDSQCPPDAISGSAFTGELYADTKLRKLNGSNDVTALPLESCGFPYYRSYRNGGRCQDAVLVKDIGVSCTFLDEEFSSNDSSKDSSMESYLVRCLKTEYNDLSEITKKISSYTSDIIRNLILRDRKREEIRSKRAVTQHENDRDKTCLKMRLKDEVRCLYRKDISNNVGSSEVSIDECKNFFHGVTEMSRTTTKGISKNRKSLQEFSNCGRSYSSSDSSSIVYDYLMMGNRQTCRRKRRETAKLIDCGAYRRFYREFDKIQNNKENIETPKQITLTNWQEISRAKLRTNKSTSKISRHTINEKHKRRDRRSYRPQLMEKFTDASTFVPINGFVQDTNFHTCFIYITPKMAVHFNQDDLGKVWKKIYIQDNPFIVCVTKEHEGWKVLLTNFKEIWSESLTDEKILERSKKLNSILVISDSEHKEVVLDTLTDIPKHAIEASTERIKLLKTFEGGRFKFELNFSKGTTEEFWENVTKPLYLSSIELIRRQNILLDLIKKKDQEIAEYKAEGAELLRKNIETKVFKEEQLQTHTIGVDEKNYIDSFQTVVEFYNTSICEQILKVEDGTAAVSVDQSIPNPESNNISESTSCDPNTVKEESDEKSAIFNVRTDKKSKKQKNKTSAINIAPIVVPSKRSKESLTSIIR